MPRIPDSSSILSGRKTAPPFIDLGGWRLTWDHDLFARETFFDHSNTCQIDEFVPFGAERESNLQHFPAHGLACVDYVFARITTLDDLLSWNKASGSFIARMRASPSAGLALSALADVQNAP